MADFSKIAAWLEQEGDELLYAPDMEAAPWAGSVYVDGRLLGPDEYTIRDDVIQFTQPWADGNHSIFISYAWEQPLSAERAAQLLACPFDSLLPRTGDREVTFIHADTPLEP